MTMAEVRLDWLPVGTALESVDNRNGAAGDKSVSVRTSALLTSDDGADFVFALEQVASTILVKVGPQLEETTTRLLAIIRRDQTATVHRNGDVLAKWSFLPGKSFQAGAPIYKDDILHIERVEFEGISIPPDAGVLHVFSFGWRRALYYDFHPLADQKTNRPFDIGTRLGVAYSTLLFQERFQIAPTESSSFFRQQWFPFVFLPLGIVTEMINHVRAGWDLDALTDKIHDATLARLPEIRVALERNTFAKRHMDVLVPAIKHFEAGEWPAAIHLTYPRIEGVLRDAHFSQKTAHPSPRSKELVESLSDIASQRFHDASPAMPSRFAEYLREVFFKGFDPTSTPDEANRNTVAHGVVPPEFLGKKEAIIGLHTLAQLVTFLR